MSRDVGGCLLIVSDTCSMNQAQLFTFMRITSLLSSLRPRHVRSYLRPLKSETLRDESLV